MVTPEELFMLIGEKETRIYELQRENAKLNQRINEIIGSVANKVDELRKQENQPVPDPPQR